MRALLKILFCLPVLLSLAACSGEKALDAFVPKTGYQLRQGIAYGPEPRQKLDIYIPDHLKNPSCTILFFYGGRWSTGDRKLYRFVGQAFASKGCVTAIADYRLYPQVRYPVFLQDNAKAFVWLHAHVKDYGGDLSRIFVAGHSAGAYNAVMLAVNPAYINQAGGKASWIRGVIGVSGPYDFLPFDSADVIDIFSPEKDTELTQPIHYVHAGLPPMLLVTGAVDSQVKPKNTINMANKLRQFNNPVTVHIYPDAHHESIILSLLNGFRGKTPLLRDIDSFIQEQK